MDVSNDFIVKTCAVSAPPLVPEVSLYLAHEGCPLWSMSEDDLAAQGIAAPFWAFAWAGGQALARHILDHPNLVRGKRVFDFAAGSGLAGIAARQAGAAHVLANDIDPMASTAMALNAALNGVSLDISTDDLIGAPVAADILLAGDICYEEPLASAVLRWLKDLSAHDTQVLIGDPGRTYLPRSDLREVALYQAETSGNLEDHGIRRTSVWAFGTSVSQA